MATSPDIRLPDELLPADGRFGSGPSKLRLSDVAHLAERTNFLGTSHRREPVKAVVRRIRAGLVGMYELPNGYEVALGLGGATAFWDAATFSLIERKSRHAVFGEFSGKFAAAVAAAPHLHQPDLVSAVPGTHPTLTAGDHIDSYALTHNETSTGVAMPVSRPPASTGLVLVDATSAAGAIEVDPTQFDVYYFSPQKALGSEGGLWLALMSPAAISRIEAIAVSKRWMPPFLDLNTAVVNSRKDQTYNTPALTTLALLADQIDWIESLGGLAAAAARCRETSAVIYAWAEASEYAVPFVTEPAMRSPTVTTIDFDPAISANDIAAVLRANGIVDTESYRKLGRNQLRIATYPSIETADAERLTAALDFIVAAISP
jgi:phosphoserine aminotransferase